MLNCIYYIAFVYGQHNIVFVKDFLGNMNIHFIISGFSWGKNISYVLVVVNESWVQYWRCHNNIPIYKILIYTDRNLFHWTYIQRHNRVFLYIFQNKNELFIYSYILWWSMCNSFITLWRALPVISLYDMIRNLKSLFISYCISDMPNENIFSSNFEALLQNY